MQKNKKTILFVICDIIIVMASLYMALMLKFDFNIQPKYIAFYKIMKDSFNHINVEPVTF